MSRSLVYRSGNVEAMSAHLATARAQVQGELDRMFGAVDGALTAWSDTTESRQAERTHQRELKSSLVAAVEALDRMRAALDSAREAAEDAERRNIALLS